MIAKVIKTKLAKEKAVAIVNIIDSTRGVASRLVESMFHRIAQYVTENPELRLRVRHRLEVRFA
jgi:hypothetical protein